MRRRSTLVVALLAAAALVLGLVAPTGASARAQAKIPIRGGSTTLTTAPGLVDGLLGAKIVAFVTAPGTQTLISPSTGPALVAKYPVTGGSVATGAASGTIRHSGGLFLTNVANGKQVAVDRFVINIGSKQLTAHIVGTTARIAVFALNLSKAAVKVRPGSITISRVGVSLLASAAAALNAALGTTAFKGGLKFGTARSFLKR